VRPADSLSEVARGYVPLLLALSALWGASYLFIKVAVEDMDPAAIVGFRLVLAAAVLLGVLCARNGHRSALDQMRATGRHGIALGLINTVIPYWLIAWGETHIDSGIAAIANSTVPIFVTLIAIRVRPSERATGQRLLGILVGLVGVGILAGVDPEGGWWGVLGTLAIVGSSLAYATANLYAQTRFTGSSPDAIAAVTVAVGAVVMLPVGLTQLPGHAPGWKTIGSIVALGVLGTAFAYLVHYRIVSRYGSTRASLVTYLLPVFALFYGAVLLNEPLRWQALGGLALILAGVALGSGLLRLRARRAALAET
jgi:drug/metabolite transporter (DMT)-like permease